MKLRSSRQVTYGDSDDECLVRRLIRRFCGGDEAALEQIITRYRTQVASLAYRMTGDYDEAADVTQLVFMKMAANLWRYDERKRFYTWLYRITVNASIDHIRKHRRHRHEPLEEYHNKPLGRRNSPEFHYRRQQLRLHIDQATDKLSDKQRSAFVLRDIRGCRVGDVARIMEMPEATVRWYLHRARAKVRSELRRRCPHLLPAMGVK